MTREPITKPCGSCGRPTTRRQPESTGRLAELLARLPFVCDKCVAEAERADQALSDQRALEAAAARTAERLKQSGLPERHHLPLAELSHAPEVLNAARGWATHGRGLLLTGGIGRGKTTIAGAACYQRLQARPVLWASAPLLLARLGSGHGTESRQWALNVLASTAGLVLDDIDKARPTEYGAEQVFLAIDQRVEHQTPLLVTTNLSPGQLAEKWPEPYGPAIASRLVGYCHVIQVTGPDRRLARPHLVQERAS